MPKDDKNVLNADGQTADNIAADQTNTNAVAPAENAAAPDAPAPSDSSQVAPESQPAANDGAKQTLSDKVDAAIEKAIDGAEAFIEKAADAAENAVDKAAGVVKGAVDAIAGRVEVELKDAKAGTHTIFHARGFTEFVDGKATVIREVADELRNSGQIKGAE